MTKEYNDLLSLREHPGYLILMKRWMREGTDLIEAGHRAASKGTESAWRYFAGQQKGFDSAISALERTLAELERLEENKAASIDIDATLREIKARPPRE